MAESHFIRWNSSSAGVNGFIMFVVLASWLLSGILLCAPTDAFAKIYVWKDARGKTHLTNRPPPEEFAKETVRNYEKTGKVGNASETKADVRLVVDTVEAAFRDNDVDALMRVYTVPGGASDAATDQVAKEALQQSLQLFFDAFGRPGKFAPLAVQELDQNFTKTGFIPEGCTATYRGFSFPFSEGKATGLIYLAICGSGKDAKLVSLNYDLKNPTPEQQKKLAEITRETIKQVAGQLAPQQQKTPAAPKPGATESGKVPARQAATPPASPSVSVAPAPKLPGTSGQVPQGTSTFPGFSKQPGMGSLPGGLDPMAFMQLASLFTGTAMLVQTAISLLFYFFTSLCVYLIARKTDTRGAWLAWVPILQIFPMIQSAGIAWWWGLVIYVAPLPLMLIPLLNVIAMFAWLLATVIFFAVVWMRICERLGMNKWLGLVMFVPLFNVVLMALLAFGSASTGPSVSVKSIVGRAIAAYVLACVVLCGGLYLYVLPMMEDVFSATAKMQHFVFPGGPQQVPGGKTPATAAPQPATAQPQTLKAPAATAAAPAVRLDKAYYDALLQRKPPNFSDDSFEQGRPETCVGPACVLLSNFWKQQDPHVWLKVRITDISYMTMLDSSKMIITDVLDTSGKNVYDAKSSFETGSFLTLRFMAHSGGYLEAIRDVHLLPGVQEADLKSVHGEMDFQFPMNAQSAEFRVQDAGQAKTAAGVRITLEKLEGNTAKIQAAGDIDRFIGVKAFDSSGKELESGSSSSMTSENGKSASYTFQGQVATLTAYVAEKILHKNYVVSLEVK